jgi:hypothetical protein
VLHYKILLTILLLFLGGLRGACLGRTTPLEERVLIPVVLMDEGGMGSSSLLGLGAEEGGRRQGVVLANSGFEGVLAIGLTLTGSYLRYLYRKEIDLETIHYIYIYILLVRVTFSKQYIESLFSLNINMRKLPLNLYERKITKLMALYSLIHNVVSRCSLFCWVSSPADGQESYLFWIYVYLLKIRHGNITIA